MLGLTHNNLGCVFKQREDHEQALYHMKRALKYESQFHALTNNSVGTIVNICSLLSRLGEHKQAFTFCQHAIAKMNITVEARCVYVSGAPASQNMVATAAIAFFNLGAEAEFLSLWKEAKQCYDTAF